MSTHVVNELFAQPGRGEDVANLLIEILGESLEWEGCEAIRIVRDQDNPDHVAGFTRWAQRQDFESYLAWRTARGFTATFEEMLTQPLRDPLLRRGPFRHRHRRGGRARRETA